MKVFVAGATGVLGRVLVPQLVARGHTVVGMTRSASKQDLVRSLGARPVVADALDPDAVAEAVARAEPEVIVHELTALSGPMSIRDARHPERFRGAIMTNRLRMEGTDHLLAAGRAVGARRFVAQSFWGVSMGPHGRAGADRGRSPRSQPAGVAAAGRGGAPISGAGGDEYRVGGGSGVALRRFLRSGHLDQPG
jgi:nucleoside-diphosphate-sugar epimerase